MIFQGILYLLVHNPSNPLIAKKNWQLLENLWPAVILSQPSEKPSVIRLKDYLIDLVAKNFLTTNIFLEVPDNCTKVAAILWDHGIKPSSPLPLEEEIKNGVVELKMKGEANYKSYNGIIEKLLNAILEKNLHWRHKQMAMNLMCALIHPDHVFPPKVIRYFLQSLIHDSIEERKIAVRVIGCVLKQLKRKHKKVFYKKSLTIFYFFLKTFNFEKT